MSWKVWKDVRKEAISWEDKIQAPLSYFSSLFFPILITLGSSIVPRSPVFRDLIFFPPRPVSLSLRTVVLGEDYLDAEKGRYD